MIRFSIGALALALAFPARAPMTTATFGPPWISIEHPVNPYDSTTKTAFLLVHAFHHGTPTNFPVSGTAEGIVRGERKSVSLEFQPTSRPGVYALKRQWPTEGTWTLVVGVTQGPEDAVYAVVELGSNGVVASVQVPTRTEKGYTLPAKVAMNAVDASLRARAGVVAQRP
ncbi:MAG: hypothetical protein IPP90_22040 [Gemmatimonadaceae bacterium]|nr:hypothetical protein [Gemmatimonadaceae bacterium]